MPDSHPIVVDAWRVYLARGKEERAAVRRQREKLLAHLEQQRAMLAADSLAAEDDLAELDRLIEWTGRKLGIRPPDEQQWRDERRRRQTRERVRRHRAAKRSAAL